jgi:hypothetical protein
MQVHFSQSFWSLFEKTAFALTAVNVCGLVLHDIPCLRGLVPAPSRRHALLGPPLPPIKSGAFHGSYSGLHFGRSSLQMSRDADGYVWRPVPEPAERPFFHAFLNFFPHRWFRYHTRYFLTNRAALLGVKTNIDLTQWIILRVIMVDLCHMHLTLQCFDFFLRLGFE